MCARALVEKFTTQLTNRSILNTHRRTSAHRRRCADVRWLGGVERRLTLTLTLILTLTLTLTLTLAPNLTLKSLGGELLHQGYLFYGIRAYEAQML